MEPIIRDVPTLDLAQRRSLEALLGHELEDNQRVYIAVLSDMTEPIAEQRVHAWRQLEQLAAKAEASLVAQGISPQTWAAVADEECAAVRYGKKP